MSDLISRKALLKEFGIDKETSEIWKVLAAYKVKDIVKIINQQPTAYDVDKVVEQLEDYKKQWIEADFLDGIDEVIDIVKGAVKDE